MNIKTTIKITLFDLRTARLLTRNVLEVWFARQYGTDVTVFYVDVEDAYCIYNNSTLKVVYLTGKIVEDLNVFDRYTRYGENLTVLKDLGTLKFPFTYTQDFPIDFLNTLNNWEDIVNSRIFKTIHTFKYQRSMPYDILQYYLSIDTPFKKVVNIGGEDFINIGKALSVLRTTDPLVRQYLHRLNIPESHTYWSKYRIETRKDWQILRPIILKKCIWHIMQQEEPRRALIESFPAPIVIFQRDSWLSTFPIGVSIDGKIGHNEVGSVAMEIRHLLLGKQVLDLQDTEEEYDYLSI